jgi:hypothetical protein
LPSKKIVNPRSNWEEVNEEIGSGGPAFREENVEKIREKIR